ncbi:fungal-specific transcription factor domain-containing protein [Mrakia frigida]|uniref:Zn(II)2Cys6 transcription factor n=1 Tax=Mrakia frigida TaxID=29902 RepID=UPI003FCC0604
MPPDLTTSLQQARKKKPNQKRTRTGCAGCRKKRYKCDEVKPICLRCLKSGDECLWPAPPQSDPHLHFRPQQPHASRSPSSNSFDDESAASTSTSTFVPPLASTSPPSYLAPTSLSTLYREPKSLIELNFAGQERILICHFVGLFQSIWFRPSSLRRKSYTSCSPPQSFDHILASLDLQHFLSSPRGSSTAHESLSLAILSVGAIQLSFLHSKSSTAYLADSNPDLAASSLENKTRYWDLSVSLTNASMALGKSSQMMMLMGGSEEEEAGLEMLSVAVVMTLSGCCLGGGGNYRDALSWGRSLLESRGGPLKILQNARGRGDAKRLRRVRAVLEELVMWEVFGSLSTGSVPDVSFANPDGSFDPLTSWFFDAPEPSAPRYITSEDWDTVVAFIGVPRALIELLRRVNTLYTVSRPFDWSSTGDNSDASPIDPIWIAQATSMLDEVALWSFEKPPETNEDSEAHRKTRLVYGTLVYSHTLDVILRVDILGYPRHHPEVQSRSEEIMRLVRACFLDGESILGFLWPTIVAGSLLSSLDSRLSVLETLELQHSVCLFELESARLTLTKVWEERDGGNDDASWRSILAQGDGLAIF